MVVINGILASDEDLKVFNEWLESNKIEILFKRKTSTYINIITN